MAQAPLPSSKPTADAGAPASGNSPATAAAAAPHAVVHLVVKADVAGSVEAVRDMLAGLETEVVGVKVVHAGVGAVTPADINLAQATGAAIVAFNLAGLGSGVEGQAVADLLKQHGVKMLSHNVIYHLMDLVHVHMEGACILVGGRGGGGGSSAT